MKRKIRKAAALKWNSSLPAPLLTAKGEGSAAEAMIRMAEVHGVEIVQEEQLSELLVGGELMEYIPVELYEAVAKVLTTVYNLSSHNES